MKTAYHIKDGPAEMVDIDANVAVANFPGEWSFDPWPAAGAEPAPEPTPKPGASVITSVDFGTKATDGTKDKPNV